MGKFTTQRIDEDGSIWATRTDPPASANTIFRVAGQPDLANDVNYGERFEVKGNGEKVGNYKLKGSTIQPTNDTDPAFKVGTKFKFSGMETISDNFQKKMNRNGIPKDVQNRLEEAFMDDKLTTKDLDSAQKAYKDAADHGRDARWGNPTNKMSDTRKGIKEFEKYEGIFEEASSGKKLREQLWKDHTKAQKTNAKNRTDDIGTALDLSKKRAKMVKSQAEAWEKKNQRDFQRTINKGRDTRSWTARSWSKITGRKPTYLVQAEAQMKGAEAEVKQAEASLVRAKNEINKAQGKGGYSGTRNEVRIAKLKERVDEAERKNELAEAKNRSAVVDFQKATIARRRQANDASGYFQKQFLKSAKGSWYKRRKEPITEQDIRAWERMSRFQEKDRYFSGVATRKGISDKAAA